MDKKNGKAIIYIVISILIVFILLAIVVIMMIANDIKMQTETFSKELIEIENNIKKIKSAGSSLPVDELMVYNKDTLLTLLSKTQQANLAAEIKENGDEEAKFYVIDMKKLGIVTSTRGDKELGGEDIYVFASPSLKVYYVGGIHIDGQSYYSVTKRLAKVTKFDEDDKLFLNSSNSEENVNLDSSITAETKSWTNALNIKIPMLIGNNKIIMQIGDKNIDITKHILDKKYTLKESEDITKELIANHNSAVIKKIDSKGVVLQEATVDISNVDISAPILLVEGEYFKVEPKTTYNEVTVTPKDDKSGVDYIIYEYIKKKDNKGQIVNVKETTVIDKEEIKTNLIGSGERSKTGIIKLPIYISEFRVLAVDKAGNVSDYLEIKIPDAYVSNEAF